MKQTMVIKSVMCALLVAVLSSASLALSAQGPAPPRPDPKPIVALKVLVTLAKFDGEKKTENLPFTLNVNSNGDPTTVNVGTRLPTGSDANTANVGTSFNIRAQHPVGTSANEGQYYLNLSISDSSLVPGKGIAGVPAVQSVSITNALLLRDGQTVEFVAATDKVTGEVTKVTVTMSVIK